MRGWGWGEEWKPSPRSGITTREAIVLNIRSNEDFGTRPYSQLRKST